MEGRGRKESEEEEDKEKAQEQESESKKRKQQDQEKGGECSARHTFPLLGWLFLQSAFYAFSALWALEASAFHKHHLGHLQSFLLTPQLCLPAGLSTASSLLPPASVLL